MRYITDKQFKQLTGIPRARLAQRTLIFSGVIIKKENKILLVKSLKTKYPGWDIPGGKVLWSENAKDTAKREALEESGYEVKLNGVVCISQRETGPDDEEYMRIIFSGEIVKYLEGSERDGNIGESKWIDIKDIESGKIEFRSKQVKQEIKTFNKGLVYPIELFGSYKW